MVGGKSFLLRWAALIYLIYLWEKYKIPGLTVGLFSEDYPTLKDRQIARIQREFPAWIGELKATAEQGYAFYLNEELGGGRILLRNLDDPSKYMSSEFVGIFVEELTRNPEQTFEDLRNRLRWPGVAEVKFMGASNPGGIGHGWVKKLFIDKNTDDPEQERFFYIHANVYDNKYVSPEYVKQLEALPEKKRKAYLEGSWDIFAGQYFTEFSRKRHVITFTEGREFVANNEVVARVGGMDWGRTNPFAFLGAVVVRANYGDRTFDRIIVYHEAYGTEKLPTDWAREISRDLRLSNYAFIDADPAMFTKGQDGSISIADQFKNFNDDFKVLLREAGNSRISGWENIHGWLSDAPDGRPYLLITENCVNLIRTLPELIHDELKPEDVDTTGEDHAPDGLRYMLSSEAMKWVGNKTGVISVGLKRQKVHPNLFNALDAREFTKRPARKNVISPH